MNETQQQREATHNDAGHGFIKRRRTTLILSAVIALGLGFMVFSRVPKLEKEGRVVDFVEQSVPVAIGTAHERLSANLISELGTHSLFAGARVVAYAGNKFPIQSEIEREARDNPALERYSRLEKEARELDFYVRAPFKDWPSEYLVDDERARFNTDFLIHLSPIDDETTRIEVIEYSPKVTLGRDFRLCGRHLVPHFTRDRRPVPPTTKDREEMLTIAVRVIQQGK